ncbi:MAG: hypothetical protein ABSG26_18240 [Bryobacteraceae bacterium]
METAYLTDELKIIACRSAARAEVDFVQTSTGFAPPDATMEGAAGGGSSGVGSGVGARHASPPMYSEYPNILDAGRRGVV